MRFQNLIAACALCLAAFAVQGMSGCSSASTQTDVWDGTSDTTWFTGDADAYDLTSAAALAGVSELAAQGESFEGVTLNLRVNVDLDERPWRPIGGDPSYGEVMFSGDFDGNGNSIVGLFVVTPYEYQAFFGSAAGGTLQNFVIRGEVQGRANAAGVVSFAENENVINVVSDVNIFGTSYYNNVMTGGVIGLYFANAPGQTFEIRDCVNNGTIDANDWAVAGIIGSAGLTDQTTLAITNCENHGYIAVNAVSDERDQCVAGVVAECGEYGGYHFDGCVNTAEVTAKDVLSIAGVVGVIGSNDSSLRHCSNSGAISTSVDDDRAVAAGICAYAAANCEVSDCSNSGELSVFAGTTEDLVYRRGR